MQAASSASLKIAALLLPCTFSLMYQHCCTLPSALSACAQGPAIPFRCKAI